MSNKLRIAGIINESIVDGPGIRMVIFAQGCNHRCAGCHNPHTHSFQGGDEVYINSLVDLVRKNPLLDGVTFSGGDPFEQADGFAELAGRIRGMGLNVVTYTGYTYEEIASSCGTRQDWAKLLSLTDILVDGRFEHTKKNMMLKFRGSENQRIIDITRTMLYNKVVLAEV